MDQGDGFLSVYTWKKYWVSQVTCFYVDGVFFPPASLLCPAIQLPNNYAETYY